MADTKIKDAKLWSGIEKTKLLPAYYAQTHYGDESAEKDMENVRIPVSVPGETSPKTMSLAALQILGQVCLCVGEDILNPVLSNNDLLYLVTVKNIIVYSMDSLGQVATWAPAWFTLPEYTNTSAISKTLLCYTVNGVMVTINVNTKAVTKRNILPSMRIESGVEIDSNLLSAPSLEFMGMTNHFDVGDTVRKDNGDGTTSFYRLNNVTTDSEGNKSAEWESLSDLKHKGDYTVFNMLSGFMKRDQIEGTAYYPVTDEEVEFLRSQIQPNGIYSVPDDAIPYPAYIQASRIDDATLRLDFIFHDFPGFANEIHFGNNVTRFTVLFDGYQGTTVLQVSSYGVGIVHLEEHQRLELYYITNGYVKTLSLPYGEDGSRVLCDNGKYDTPQNIVFKPKEVTTLSRLPIDKYGIKATVTEATPLSFAITPNDGMEYVIDILNNTDADIVQPLPNGDDWQVPKDSITLVAGKVTEISVRYVFGKYVVKV